jgi:hypothetical protein
VSEPTPVRRARRTLAVTFFTAATVAALVAPTWIALHDSANTDVGSSGLAAPTLPTQVTPSPTESSPVESPTEALSHAAVTLQTPTKTPSPSTTPQPASTLTGDSWHRLPTAPIPARTEAAAAWTGTAMIVWGGAAGAQLDQLRSDGVEYDPTTNAWTTLPESPLSAREDPAAVWTGNQLFVWGGYDDLGNTPRAASDGALYDPMTRRWRKLPPAPLAARTNAQALAVDGRIYVIGGRPAVTTGSDQGFSDAASYDPASDRWAMLPSAPSAPGHQVIAETAVAAGDRIDVFQSWQQVTADPGSTDSGDTRTTAGIDALSYDTTTGSWEALPAASIAWPYQQDKPDGLNGVFWTGQQLIVPAAQLWCGECSQPFQPNTHGWVFDPTTLTWTPIPHGPADDDSPSYLWTSAGLLAYDSNAYSEGPDGVTLPGLNALWNPATGRWTSLPASPMAGAGVAVWTGNELIEWGALFTPSSAGEGGVPVTHNAAIAFGP